MRLFVRKFDAAKCTYEIKWWIFSRACGKPPIAFYIGPGFMGQGIGFEARCEGHDDIDKNLFFTLDVEAA